MSLPRAKKEFGQHFLKDKKIIEKITTDWHEKSDVIIEVGPGPGVLTQKLKEHNKALYVIEKDLSMKPYLEKMVAKENIFFEDALKFNWDHFLKKNDLLDKDIWLVSNLPYNVGTPLFTGFMQLSQIKYMTLMFQKEVGDKTYPKENQHMSGLLFLSQNYFESKLISKALPGAFNPPPKVDSVVVSFLRKETPDIPISEFSRLNSFTRKIFSMKRKQLGKVISATNLDIELKKVELDRTRRVETLTYQELLMLYKNLHDV